MSTATLTTLSTQHGTAMAAAGWVKLTVADPIELGRTADPHDTRTNVTKSPVGQGTDFKVASHG